MASFRLLPVFIHSNTNLCCAGFIKNGYLRKRVVSQIPKTKYGHGNLMIFAILLQTIGEVVIILGMGYTLATLFEAL